MKRLTFVTAHFALFTFTRVVAAQGQVEDQVEDTGDPKGPVAKGSVPQDSPSENVNVCEGITCSEHGSCVQVFENPVCVCHDGYRTDTESNLSCLPHPITGPVIVNQPQPSESLVSQSEYEAALEKRKMGTTIMVFGYISLGVSAALLSIAGWMPPDGSKYNCEEDGCSTIEGNDVKIVALTSTSIGTLVLGLSLTIPGIIKRRRAGRIMRQFESQQKTQSSVAPRISSFLSLSSKYRATGLRVSF